MKLDRGGMLKLAGARLASRGVVSGLGVLAVTLTSVACQPSLTQAAAPAGSEVVSMTKLTAAEVDGRPRSSKAHKSALAELTVEQTKDGRPASPRTGTFGVWK